MERSRLLLTAVSAAILGALFACTPSIPKYSFTYAEKRAELDNGLRLVVIPDQNTPMVHVAVRYLVGSNEDPPGKAGLAHLVEHMMFQHRMLGADKPPTFEFLPQIATFYNAFTNFETTHYMLEARAEDVDGLLRLEAARMSLGCDTIPEEEFEREREVVRNEIRQRSGTPEGLIQELLLQAVYPEGHAYNQTIGGTDEQLSSITFEDVCTFMKEYYVPQRATLVVAGNVDIDDIGQKVAQYFGPIEAGTPAPRKEIDPIDEFEHQIITEELATERSQLFVMWRIPSYFGEDGTKAQLMTGSLCGRVSRFNMDWDFAANVGCAVFPTKLAPFLMLSIELYKESDKEEALGYVWRATKSIHRGFESGIFNRETKAVTKARFIQELEPLSARAERVAELVQFRDDFDFGSGGEYLLEEIQRMERIDGGEFGKFMKGRLAKDNALVLFVRSNKEGRKGDQRAGLRYKAGGHEAWDSDPVIDPAEALRPLPVPESRSLLNDAQRYELENGMNVVLLPFKGWPVVTAHLMFGAGSAHEPQERAGLASVAASYLYPPRDSDIGKTGVSFRGSATSDTTAFVGRGMEIYLDVVLRGLERLIKVGQHDQRAIERWQKQMKIYYESEKFRRRHQFQRELASAIYGPEHPYTLTGSPTRETLGKIGRDAAMDFKRKHYSAANATLIVVGSFDAEEAKRTIEEHFGGWSSGHVDEPVSAAPPARSGPEYFGLIDPSPNPQVNVSIAYPSPAGIDGQHAARLILAEMLNLRMGRVRSQLGSTYGTYASRRTQRGPSAFVMGGSVDKERAGESLAFIREQIDALRRGEDFEADFAQARRIVLKRLLAESSETRDLAGRLAQIARYDLELNHYDELMKFVGAAPPALVQALVQQELRPEAEIIGAMGDRAALEGMFEEAGISGARYVESE